MYSESDASYTVTTGAKFSVHFIGITQTAPAFLVQINDDFIVTNPPNGEVIKPYFTAGRAKLFNYLTG